MTVNPVLKRILIGTGLILTLLFFLKEPWRGLPYQYVHQQVNKTAAHQIKDGIKTPENMLSEVRQWQEETKVRKIVGLVFYGRRHQASILDCYLKRNLVKNGGVLDEVVWLQRTKDNADLAFLDKLMGSETSYSRVDVERIEGGFASAYDVIKDDILYVKVDTDIVYIEDTTILSMVHTRAVRPEYYVVGANVINQPLSSWLHWGLGAVRPYLPENKTYEDKHEQNQGSVDWRASVLPEWSAPKDFDIAGWSPPEGRKHRWLPVPNRINDHILDGTPILTTTYDAHTSSGWWNWIVGAQQHYSFFENLEKDELWRYRFHTWDYRDLRMGIQLIAITGRDINIAKPIAQDDEDYFCVQMPRKLGRSAVAAGGGVASHFSFSAQKDGMATTDILDRYRSYAQEKICKGPMLWTSEADDAPL